MKPHDQFVVFPGLAAFGCVAVAEYYSNKISL